MNFLDIRKEEALKMAITWSMCALLSIGYAIGWSAVHSMLVKRMGVEYLPYTYIGISLLGVFGSSVYLVFADAVRRDRLLIAFAGATGLALLLSRLLVTARPEGEKGLTLPLVLFFSAVFFAQGVGNSTLGTQVWTIINDLFRPSQGRRLYPILGTAGTIGGIAGGASIHFLAGTLGTANLVIIWTLAIWLLIPMTILLRKNFGGELRGSHQKSSSSQNRLQHYAEGWKFLLSSRMSLILGVVAVMFWVVGSVADFQYTKIMSETFHSESKLAGYYGVYGIVINASGFLVQVFFSGYLIRRIGIAKGLCALPLTALIGFAAIATRFAFVPGLALRYCWDMVGMTLQGNSYQLAMNSVPAALRARVRGFIDGVINPLGGVLGGVLILVLHRFFDAGSAGGWLDPVTLSAIILAVVWFVVVSRSGKIYIETISNNLHSPELRTVMDAIDCLEEPGNPRAERLLDEVAAMPEPEKRAAAARIRGAIRNRHSVMALAESCADPSPAVRRASIRALMGIGREFRLPPEVLVAVHQVVETDPDMYVRSEAVHLLLVGESPARVTKLAEHWLQHPSSEVRVRVVEALSEQDVNKQQLLAPMLSDPSPSVRAAAVCALWSVNDSRVHSRSVLATLLGDESHLAHAPSLIACFRIGECPHHLQLPQLIDSLDPVVRVLAGVAVLRFSNNSDHRLRALDVIFQTLAIDAFAERLRNEVLPLVPDFGEDASDLILLAAAKLPADTRESVAHVLSDWHKILEARVEAGR